jgi:adenine-specific DNA-methyltransferase
MQNSKRTPEDNQKEQLENEISRLKKKIAKYEAIELKQNRFGLVWLDVPEAFEDDVENKLPILEEVPKLAITSKDDKPTHLLIEGDNYHALTCLNYTHKGKIDVIYIDPPYNTGSDGFKYKDKRILEQYPDGTEVPVDHPLRHSYWLSFMKKRLELAKSLLKDTGVIFISIDDNELAQLKLLCDEIFSPLNFENVFTIKVRHENRILRQDIRYQQTIEYLLCYRASSNFNPARLPIIKDKDGDYTHNLEIISKKPRKIEKINGYDVEIYFSNDYKLTGVKAGLGAFKPYSIRGSLITQKGSAAEFYEKHLRGRKKQDGLGALYKIIGMGARGDGLGYRYVFQPEKENIKNGSYLQGRPIKENVGKGLPYPNFWDFVNEFNTVGYEGGVEFKNGKKPIAFLNKILELAKVDKDSIILDFFAGSASTLHAVSDYNEKKSLKCQTILVTNNENNIAKKITLPRIKNVFSGLNGVKKYGGSIKYFKTAFVGKNNILNADDTDKIELAHNAGGMLAIAENTFDQVEQNNYWQIFENSKQYLAIYFREEFSKFDDFIEKVKKQKKPAVVYIFSWEKEFEFNDFDDDKNITIKTIPQPILEIYKQIYNLV